MVSHFKKNIDKDPFILCLIVIDLPEDNVNHLRVARSPQFFGHRHHGGFGGGGYPGGFGGRGYYPQQQPQVAQSQATAQAQNFSIRGNLISTEI